MEKIKQVLNSPKARKKSAGSAGTMTPGGRRSFGVPLEEVLERDGIERGEERDIPIIIEKFCTYLSEYGANQEGIFRINGGIKAMERLKGEFERLGPESAEIGEGEDVMTVASLLKQYLRDLPESLIPENMTTKFVKIHDTLQKEGRQDDDWVNIIKGLLDTLPTAHFTVLRYIIRFLVSICQLQSVNKMSPMALAIVFGPNIFKCTATSIEGLRHQGVTNEILCRFIQGHAALFGALPGATEQSPLHAQQPRIPSANESRRKTPPVRPPPPKLDGRLGVKSRGEMEGEEGVRPSPSPRLLRTDEELTGDRTSPFTFMDSDGPSTAPSPVLSSLASELVIKTITESLSMYLFNVGGEEHTLHPLKAGLAEAEWFNGEEVEEEEGRISAATSSSNPHPMDRHEGPSGSVQNHLPGGTLGGGASLGFSIPGPPVSLAALHEDARLDAEEIARLTQSLPHPRRANIHSAKSERSSIDLLLEKSTAKLPGAGSDESANHVSDSKPRPLSASSSSSNHGVVVIGGSGSSTPSANQILPVKPRKAVSAPPRRNPSSQQNGSVSTKSSDSLPELATYAPPRPLVPPRDRHNQPHSQTVELVGLPTTTAQGATTAEQTYDRPDGGGVSIPANSSLPSAGGVDQLPAIPSLDFVSTDQLPAIPPLNLSPFGIQVIGSRMNVTNGAVKSNGDISAAPGTGKESTPSPKAAANSKADEKAHHVKQLNRKINAWKKRIRSFEEEFEKQNGRKPTSQEKSAKADIKKATVELQKARKEVKALKEEIAAGASSAENHPEGQGSSTVQSEERAQDSLAADQSGDGSLGKSAPGVSGSGKGAVGGGGEEVVGGEEKRSGLTATLIAAAAESDQQNMGGMLTILLLKLAEKREESSRPEDIGTMTADQIQDEKLSVQKSLLHFESVHGRPSTKAQKELMRPLYDRYRNIKKALTNPKKPSGGGVGPPSAGSLPPSNREGSGGSGTGASSLINGHPAMSDSTAALHPPELPSSDTQTDQTSTSAGAQRSKGGGGSGRRTSSQAAGGATGGGLGREEPKGDLPSGVSGGGEKEEDPLSREELVNELNTALGEKKRLRRVLREFEDEFQRANGRKVQKDDRAVKAKEYHEYKQIKAKITHMEKQITEHGDD